MIELRFKRILGRNPPKSEFTETPFVGPVRPIFRLSRSYARWLFIDCGGEPDLRRVAPNILMFSRPISSSGRRCRSSSMVMMISWTFIKIPSPSHMRRGNPPILPCSSGRCTYASEDDQRLLASRGITCIMNRRGNCYDNAVMESFFSTVKSVLGERFESNGEAKMQLFDYIEVFCNQRRRHSSVGRISPAECERRATAA